MRTINIHEAKTHLSRLVDQAAAGEPFIIAKAGKPIVRVVPLDTPDAAQRSRLGFLAGQIAVPDDFDTMGAETIEDLFDGRR
jgi:prevent-host-death family protein